MSTQGDDEGLVDVFVKGIVFTLAAAAAGLILRKVFRQQPEVVVVAVEADELGVGRTARRGRRGRARRARRRRRGRGGRVMLAGAGVGVGLTLAVLTLSRGSGQGLAVGEIRPACGVSIVLFEADDLEARLVDAATGGLGFSHVAVDG